jgi:hypothetical protein
MAFAMTPNMVPDEESDWGDYSVEHTCPWPRAQRVAMRDPNIKSFFICRTATRLRGKTFAPGDAVFVRTAAPLKENLSCDVYQKRFFNVGYLDPRLVPLRHAGTLRLADDHRSFFDIVCLLAVGMHGSAVDVRLAFSEGLDHALNHTDDVAVLQSLGISVLLSVIGDWGDAGWSKFPNTEEGAAAAAKFAKLLVDTVNKYGLDGIEIDDEYSTDYSNDTSLIMVTSKLRELAPGIVVSKALWSDQSYFAQVWKGKTLAQQLTYGWEMTYSDTTGISRLNQYTDDPPQPEMRLQKHQLALGVRNYPDDPGNSTPPEAVTTQAKQVKDNAYGGMMIFGVDDILRAVSFATLVSKELYDGQNVELNRLGCWGLPTGALALMSSVDVSGQTVLYVDVAGGGQAFGVPIAAKAANSDRQEATNIGSAMAIFKDRLWCSWIGPKTEKLDSNYLNVCSANIDPAQKQLTFGNKKVFDSLPRSVLAPASVGFGERLYVAWTDGAGSLQLLSGDGENAWLHQGTIAEQVTSPPALAVIGGRLCLVAADSKGLFAMRSEDGVGFKDRTPIRIEGSPLDVGATLYADWIYLACIVESGGTKVIRVLRSQDGVNYEGFAAPERTSQGYAGVRIATLGPDLYIVAKDGPSELRLWFTTWKDDFVEFADRGILPSITSVSMPSLISLGS